jgi:hypothetical protein
MFSRPRLLARSRLLTGKTLRAFSEKNRPKFLRVSERTLRASPDYLDHPIDPARVFRMTLIDSNDVVFRQFALTRGIRY